MKPTITVRAASAALAVLAATLSFTASSHAAAFPEFVDPNPAAGNGFGTHVVPLSTGNVVITSPNDDAGGANAGAVYLFNGATGALISTLRGSSANDVVGSGGVVALTNGNFVVISINWDNGAAGNAGAVTWGSGVTGVNGVVSAANSLVGSTASDVVGSPGVTALANGNYVVSSVNWDNGAVTQAGAATWGNGATGTSGVISGANSLVGSTANDQVGAGVQALPSGNYVVSSPNWDFGVVTDAGAATWGNGTTGVSGAVSIANSLIGSTVSDRVGDVMAVVLTNGNYVVASPLWNNGAIADAGAATWGKGTTGVSGLITPANSLVGPTASDQVSAQGVFALSNGNYVVNTASWDNGGVANVGAVTWGNGATGTTGTVSLANSIVGSTLSDQVGSSLTTVLTNGNYVVRSPNWDNGAIANAGAATWAPGIAVSSFVVSAANSLVGTTATDNVGSNVFPLTNGNYVVRSLLWDNGAAVNAGAVTWGNGAAGVTGAVSAANSLVGSTTNDQVGSSGVAALANGNYVAASSQWDNGGAVDAGAATWGNGAVGTVGTLSAANSLVGSVPNDNVGAGGVIALSNGNYVVGSGAWDNGAINGAGAATWGSGVAGVVGPVSAANSLVGSSAGDAVGGSPNVIALPNGNYLVRAAGWDHGAILNAGSVTWANGATGIAGTISLANSLIGTAAGDVGGVNVLSNGNYVLSSGNWDDGPIVNAGAATWGSGSGGVIGFITASNSVIGASANTTLQVSVAEDIVNGNFYARFLAEGGGRVRVGTARIEPLASSLVDIPADQGGWLRLTFLRSPADAPGGLTPVTNYGIWRHVPGTVARRLLAASHVSLDPEITAAFPPGTWALIANVPAVQQNQYVADVPTVSNAAPNDFVITAHTTVPTTWFISSQITAQSIDNLAPAIPEGLNGAYASGQTNLDWDPNTENDIGSYRVYRGTSAGFVPSVGNLIATVTTPGHGDVGPAGRFYKVSAVDVNGNESGFALLTPGETTGIEGGPVVVFTLEGARPNPATKTRVNVAFALPNSAPARLELLDISGRRVVSREVGSLGAGRHTVNLSQGSALASGLYWVRLTQGANQQKARVAVIE